MVAQEKTLDSLLAILKTIKEDTARVNTLVKIVYQYRSAKPQTALLFADSAISLAKKLDYRLGLANSYCSKGSIDNLAKFEELLNYNDSALSIYDDLLSTKPERITPFLNGKSASFSNKAKLYLRQGIYPLALKNYAASLRIGVFLNEVIDVANKYSSIGNVYLLQGNYPQALKYALYSLKIFEKSGNQSKSGFCNGLVGSIYRFQEDYEEAIKYYTIAVKIFESIGDEFNAEFEYIRIGDCYAALHDFSMAMLNYELSLKIATKTGDIEGIGTYYYSVGWAYENQGKYNEALKFSLIAYSKYKEGGFDISRSEVANLIGSLYSAVGNYNASIEYYTIEADIKSDAGDPSWSASYNKNLGAVYLKQKDFGMAVSSLNKSLGFYEQAGNLPEICEIHRLLLIADSSNGNYRAALNDYRSYALFSDSLSNENNTRELVQTRMQFDFDKKVSLTKAAQEKMDLLMAEELKRQKLLRNSFIAGMILLVIVMIILVKSIQRRKLVEKQAAQLKTMIDTQESERKRISRDLHDDIGTKLSALGLFLSSMREKASGNGNAEIRELAQSSEQFIKETVHDLRELLLDLSPSVLEDFGYTTAVEGLINKINQTRLIHFNLVIFGIKERLSKEYELALYRITQELVNNVLKHAEAKKVTLQIGRRDDLLILMIEDDGKGFEIAEHQDGYGLKNLSSRTELLQGKMTIDSAPGKGTSVLIEIPYKD